MVQSAERNRGATDPSSSMDPEQASMLFFDGEDATAITAFTWSRIERRLAELTTNKLLERNDAGHIQKVPFKTRELGGERTR